MKIILVLFVAALIATTGCGQKLSDDKIPEAVKTAMKTMYPDVKTTKWEMEDGMYEAEFDQNKTEISVLFKADGSLYQTEAEINVTDLPAEVNLYLTKKLPGEKIKEASKIIFADGTINYEAEAGGKDYLFDAQGNFIGIESDDADTEDDKD